MNKQCGKVKHFCAYCQKYFKYFLVQRTQTEGLARRPEGKVIFSVFHGVTARITTKEKVLRNRKYFYNLKIFYSLWQ